MRSRSDTTRSPNKEYQWPHKKGLIYSNFYSKRKKIKVYTYLPCTRAGRTGPYWCLPGTRTSPRRLSPSHSGDRPTHTSGCTGPGRKQYATLQPRVSQNKRYLLKKMEGYLWILNTSVRGRVSRLSSSSRLVGGVSAYRGESASREGVCICGVCIQGACIGGGGLLSSCFWLFDPQFWEVVGPANGTLLLPPANEVCKGYVFTGVCLSTVGSAPLHAGIHTPPLGRHPLGRHPPTPPPGQAPSMCSAC